jgi:flagellar assembly protein FliH
MSDFTAGFVARQDAAARALHHAFSGKGGAFSPADIKARASGAGPVSFSPQPAGPRHFTPADPEANPTEGWDPFASPTSLETATDSFVDPIELARAAGYAEGKAAAEAAAATTQARDRLLLEELAGALGAGGQLDRERMAQQLRQTVLHLVGRIVGEVGVSPELLAARVAIAADMLSDSAESALLYVHPEDVALIEGKLPKTVFAAGDAGIVRGSFILESASTIVEDGPELWLEQLAQAIDRIAVPRD